MLRYLPGPRVHAGHLKSEVPGTAVSALTLGPSTHSMAVRLAILPAAAVRASVVEVESTSVEMGALVGCDGSACGGGRCRRRTRRIVEAPRRRRKSLLHPTLLQPPSARRERSPYRMPPPYDTRSTHTTAKLDDASSEKGEKERRPHYKIALIASINSVNGRGCERITSHIAHRAP